MKSLETTERQIEEFERYANLEIGIVIREAEGPMRTHL